MYYLDLHGLYTHSEKSQRIVIRKSFAKLRNEIMEARLKEQRNQCFYCCCEIDMSSHLDHLIPVYYGGTNRRSNLVASCKSCNMTKMTDQIEITNPYTINDYLKLIDAYKKWRKKLNKAVGYKAKNRLMRYQPKRVRLYHVYRADLFKSIKVKHI